MRRKASQYVCKQINTPFFVVALQRESVFSGAQKAARDAIPESRLLALPAHTSGGWGGFLFVD